jgi:hypothetical protein
MVNHKDRQRLAVAHRILDTVRSRSFRSESLSTQAGEHVIVPALADDTMASLFEQLSTAGGPINVAVADGNDLIVFAMSPIKPPRHAGAQADPDEDFPMSPGMSVGIVLDYLRLRDKPIIFHEASPQVSLELVEDPNPGPAPKASHSAAQAASGHLAVGPRCH